MGLKEDSDGFWVATVEGKIAGITLSWVRGSLWYLAHLFVSPKYQGLDIGRNLMEKAMRHHKETPITNRALVTFAYNPVSISLYARHGMYPREPMYYMECPSGQVKAGPANTKLKNERVTDFEKNITILSRIDERTLGYPREKNHEFLFSLPTVRCHLYSTPNEPVGYAYVWQNGRIGPLATTSPTIFQEVLRSAFKLAAAEGASNVALLATGSNKQADGGRSRTEDENTGQLAPNVRQALPELFELRDLPNRRNAVELRLGSWTIFSTTWSAAGL